MKPNVALFSLFFVVPLLAGCNVHRPIGFTPTCFATVCTVNPDSPDARYMLKTYGLHQLTLDVSGGLPYRPQVEGSIVAWEDNHPGKVGGQGILVYDFSTNKISRIGTVSHDLVYAEQYLANKLLVYASWQVNENGNPISSTEMKVYDLHTHLSRVLDTNMTGDDDPWGFDGKWVLFAHRYSPNPAENALWATNLDTGQKVRLYVPVPHSNEHNGTWVDLADGMTVSGG